MGNADALKGYRSYVHICKPLPTPSSQRELAWFPIKWRHHLSNGSLLIYLQPQSQQGQTDLHHECPTRFTATLISNVLSLPRPDESNQKRMLSSSANLLSSTGCFPLSLAFGTQHERHEATLIVHDKIKRSVPSAYPTQIRKGHEGKGISTSSSGLAMSDVSAAKTCLLEFFRQARVKGAGHRP